MTPGGTPAYLPERPRGRTLAAEGRLPPERVALVDLLDRLLAGGVVITGDIVLSIADIDLVRISLRALLGSVHGTEPFDPLGEPYAEGGRAPEDRAHGRREGGDERW
ncbi:gas vesicle protein [Microbispora bryophytorum]|uniref:Gas vesicle protein n=1 Tax=Microbispora bryophytorum subsp. camponoti TaxID=1677852 RepID=A0ABR8L5M7_9ACTN|nr:gas vesicle protein [Microbispora camponoti]MBD3146240.1 gas vesicle protein [Microbispora camponoti]